MDKSPVLGLGKSLAEWSDAQMYEQNFSKILKFLSFICLEILKTTHYGP